MTHTGTMRPPTPTCAGWGGRLPGLRAAGTEPQRPGWSRERPAGPWAVRDALLGRGQVSVPPSLLPPDAVPPANTSGAFCVLPHGQSQSNITVPSGPGSACGAAKTPDPPSRDPRVFPAPTLLLARCQLGEGSPAP